MTLDDALRARELQINILLEQDKRDLSSNNQPYISQLRAEIDGLMTMLTWSQKHYRKTLIIDTPPQVAAYVVPGFTKSIYASANPLDISRLDWDQILTHENFHLKQYEVAGNMEMPGFDRLHAYHHSLFAREFGMSASTHLSEREWIEAFTELAATQEAGFNKDCLYNERLTPY